MQRRGELILSLFVACALVVARSYIFWAYEQAHITSDQAIVGLMAKHIAEGRAWPLYFYGQSYLLAVEAWLVAPFLWIGGPTMASLRAGMVAINLATVVLLVWGLVRWGRLRPLLALVAVLPFAIAPPFTSSLLVEAQGGNVEPLAFVVLFWWLRARPLALGLTLGIAVFNREFTIFALPVLVLADVVEHGWPTREFWRRWLLAGVMFVAVWQATSALKPYADMMGPGTRGQMLGGSAGSELKDVTEHMGLSWREWPSRVVANATRFFPLLMGAVHVDDVVASQGRNAMRWPLLLALAAMLARALWLAVASRNRDEPVRFAGYLAGVGVSSMLCLALVWGLDVFTLRYMMMSLLLPVGVVALVFALEPVVLVRRVVVALVVAWALFASIDNVALMRRYAAGVPDVYGEVAKGLVARGITVAQAPYWHAYRLTFLSGERVKIASTDFVRINEYQGLANAAGDQLITLQEQPCGAAEKLGPLYLCKNK